jgi:hypothetical protein
LWLSHGYLTLANKDEPNIREAKRNKKKVVHRRKTINSRKRLGTYSNNQVISTSDISVAEVYRGLEQLLLSSSPSSQRFCNDENHALLELAEGTPGKCPL